MPLAIRLLEKTPAKSSPRQLESFLHGTWIAVIKDIKMQITDVLKKQ